LATLQLKKDLVGRLIIASRRADIPDGSLGKWYYVYLGKSFLHFLGYPLYEIEVVSSLQPFDCISQP
jgi:hypothetical protein